MAEIIFRGILYTLQALLQNPLYWVGVLVCYVLYERKAPFQSLRLTVLSVFQGLTVGSLVTGIMIGIGLSIRQKQLLMALLPISVGFSLINKRWICYAYSAALLALPLYCAGIMKAQTVSGLLCIVGILHISEAILCFMSNESERTWPLSFGMLMEGRSGLPTAMPEWWPLYGELPVLSILPLTAMLTYQGKRTLSDRRKHRRKEGIRILLYGLLVAALGIMSFRMAGLLIPALLIQVMAHEYITLCS